MLNRTCKTTRTVKNKAPAEGLSTYKFIFFSRSDACSPSAFRFGAILEVDTTGQHTTLKAEQKIQQTHSHE
jgi:hypothetical protein